MSIHRASESYSSASQTVTNADIAKTVSDMSSASLEIVKNSKTVASENNTISDSKVDGETFASSASQAVADVVSGAATSVSNTITDIQITLLPDVTLPITPSSAVSAMDSLSNTEKMAIRSSATLVEIIGGQPLDRIKVNLQLPQSDRVPFRTLLNGGIGSFYAASATSVVQRCFFYIPAVYFGADLWQHYFKLDDFPVLDGVASSFFTSTLVTPGVSCFESLKLQQQTNMTAKCSLYKTAVTTYHNFGIRGLFPSMLSTFSREAAFCLGMCYISPTVHQFLKENYNVDSVIAAGCVAGVTTQLITQPFDTVKTWQEKTHHSFVRSVRDMVRENGIKFVFNGTFPRVFRGMWTFSCLFYCTNEFSAVYKSCIGGRGQ